MPSKGLWIFVEGNDDERFLQEIGSVSGKSHDWILRPWKYSQKPKKLIRNFLASLRQMGVSYLFLSDINFSPCVSDRRSKLQERYEERLNVNNVVVVEKEIEAWYLAGLDDNSCKELGIRRLAKTDTVTKEQFDRMIPGKFDSRIDFMIEVLKKFSVETARKKNKSFAYFLEKIREI